MTRVWRRHRRDVLGPQTAYRVWAPTYPPTAHNPLMSAEQDAMVASLAGVAGHSRACMTRALDLGSGSGRYVGVLRRAGARTVVALDFSWPMLTRNVVNASRVCADAMALPLAGDAFDVVVAGLMVGDVGNLARWAAEVQRVLHRGGQLVYSDFHPSWAANGWERTVRRADGRVAVLPYHTRSLRDQRDALACAGLVVRDVREPHLGHRHDPQVRAMLARWGDLPVAAVIRASKG